MPKLSPDNPRLISKSNRHKKIIFSKIIFWVLTVIFLFCLYVATYFVARYCFSRPSKQILSSSSLISSTSSVRSDSLPSSTPSNTSNTPTAPTTLISSIINFFAPSDKSDDSSEPTSPDSLPSAANSFVNDQSNFSDPDWTLTFGVYSDNFPNSVYIDQSRTTLYQDDLATAVFFPPAYDWQNADSSSRISNAGYFSGLSFNDFSGPYGDRRCLGNNCLELKNSDLYYNGKILTLPDSLISANIAAVSISALTKRWLVGVTIKEGEKNYRGRVFYFDGSKFTEIITPAPVISSYFGPWGFGGEESDFLIIYGAYEGIAYRVRGNKLTDISRFFPIRAMNNGFKAEVIKTVYGTNVNWYVYSSTLNRPRFFKLWQNRSPEIVGEVFFPDFFNNTPRSAAFKLLNIDNKHIGLLAQIKSVAGQTTDKIFTDYGFNNSSTGILTTVPVSNYTGISNIIIKKIYDVKLDIDPGSQSAVQYLFSIGGREWHSLVGADGTDFAIPADPLYLKVIFSSSTDKFYSPYLDSMLFSFYWKNIEAPSSSSSIPPVSSSVKETSTVPSANLNVSEPVISANETPLSPPVNQQPPAAPLIPADAIRIKVSAAGFVPNIFSVKAGQSVTLAISSDDNNAHVFIFPRASLIALTTMVLGSEIKTVTFTAPAAGTYNFRDDIPEFRNNTGEMIVK
ncbi:MAG: cupredoxin domain-containing protein [Patescibacteria group bacterium]|jgi:hypothetical protein